MPTEITIQNLSVQDNKLVVTPQPVSIPDATDIETTPLAEVAENTLDTILGVKDGAVRQASVEEVVSLVLSDYLRGILVNYGNITISSSGYTAFAEVISPPTGYKLLFALMWNFGTASPPSAFGVTAEGQYVYGEPNTTISNLRVLYIYQKL